MRRMNRKLANKLDLFLYTITILILVFGNFCISKAKADTRYCRAHYCAKIPDDVIAINKDNWEKYKDVLPDSIAKKLAEGSERELWVFENDKRMSVAVEYKDGKVRIDNPRAYCREIKEKLKEPSTSCGHLFPYERLKGLQSITWMGEDEVSFIRVFMPLNGGSVNFVCTGRWKDQEVVMDVYKKVRKIISEMRIKK